MELFIIIFIVLFWVIKFSVEKHKTEKCNLIQESQLHLQSQMRLSLATSKEMYDEIEAEVYNSDYCEKIFNQLGEELTTVHGQDFRSRLDIHRRDTMIRYMDDGYWICQMLLAKQGKVGIGEVISGYYLGDDHYSQRNIKYCKQIEKLLKKRVTVGGAYVHLFLTPKRYSIKEDYQYPINMNYMNFLFNLQQYGEDVITKGAAWNGTS